MKKVISFMLSLVMLVSITAGLDFSTYAIGGSDGDYKYEVIEDGTAKVTEFTGKLDVVSDIAIPSKVDDKYKVTQIGSTIFKNMTELTSVSIPGTITKICYDAFYGCTGLTSIYIPESVKRIDSGAFYGCLNLQAIHILYENGEGLESVGNEAFASTAWLEAQDDGVIYVGNVAYDVKNQLSSKWLSLKSGTIGVADSAFSGNSTLEWMTLPNSIRSIGTKAFYCCKNLNTINLALESLSTIGDSAFQGCSSLENVELGNVENIGKNAFAGSGLTEIAIDSNIVEEIGEYAFASCGNLENFIILSDNYTNIGKYSSDIFGNSLYSQYSGNPDMIIYSEKPLTSNHLEGKTWYWAECFKLQLIEFYKSEDGNIAISYRNYSEKENVILPEKIQQYTVKYLSSLYSRNNNTENITLPKTITGISPSYPSYIKIGDIFAQCHNLENIYVATDNPVYTSIDGVLYSKDGTELLACPLAKVNVTIPESVKIIDSHAFIDDGNDYYSNHVLTFGNNLSSINEPIIEHYDDHTSYTYQTVYCYGTTAIYVTDTIAELSQVSFPQLENIYVTDSSTNYASYDGCLYNKDFTQLIAVPAQKDVINFSESINVFEHYGLDFYSHYYRLSNTYKPISAINVPDENNMFYSADGVLFSKDKTELISYPSGKNDKAYTVPNGTKIISSSIPWDYLEEITVPDTVVEMTPGGAVNDGIVRKVYGYSNSAAEKYVYDTNYDFDVGYEEKLSFVSLGISETQYAAFDYKSLDDYTVELCHYHRINEKEIEIPSTILGKTVSRIGKDLFTNGDYYGNRETFNNLIIPDTVTSIGESAFCGITIKDLTLGKNVEVIEDGAFRWCDELSEISIPESVTSIGSMAFDNNVTDVYYSGTIEKWNNIEIGEYCLTNATIHCSDGDIIPDSQDETNEPDYPDDPDDSEKSISLGAIVSGETKAVTVDNAGSRYYYTFTPEYDSDFTFTADSDADTYGYVYVVNEEGEWDQLDSDDDSGNGGNFKIDFEAEAGKTYILESKFYSSDKTGSFNVSLTENPVKSITFTPVKPYEFIENIDGYWEEDDDDAYFYYNTPSFKEGDVLTVTYKDERGSVDYIFDDDEWEFVSENGETVYATGSSGQYEKHWTVGGENYFTVNYQGVSTQLPVTIIENPVQSIEFELASPIILCENQGGHYDIDIDGKEYGLDKDETGYYYEKYNDDTDEYNKVYVDINDINDENVFFFYSSIPFSKDGNKLIVHYKDGTSETLTQHFFFDSKNRGFKLVDENGEIVEDSTFRYNWEITKDKPFTLGSDNYITVEYLNHTTTIPVTVTENNVDKIEFITAKPIEFNIDDKNDLYFYEWDDGYEYSFNVRKNIFTDGNALKVFFNDGTTKTYRFYNEYEFLGTDEYNPVIGYYHWAVNENGSVINYDLFNYDGTDIKFYDYGNDVNEIQWSAGNVYHIKFTYLGAETIVPITLTSNSSTHTHSYTTQVVAPTCTEQGYTIYTCSCGDTYNDNYVNALGHTEVVDKAVAPTCTVKGKTEGKHCSVCNKVLIAQTEVAALGHKWDSGKVTKKATPTATGVKTYTCSVCGTTKTETIAKCAKYANTLTAKGKTATVKFANLKKKNQTVAQKNAFTISKAQGKVTYKKTSGNKKITVAKNGKITVKKGLKKGTYKIKIKVTAAGNTTYKAATKTVTVTIKVK